MGFFDRSKKMKKESPAARPRDARRAPVPTRPAPPPPPRQVPLNWAPAGLHPQPAAHQSVGFLPPPPGWNGGSQPQVSCPSGAYPPIIVNQHHYYLAAPPPHLLQAQAPGRPNIDNTPLGKLDLDSALDLAKDVCQATGIPRLLEDALPRWHGCGNQLVSQGSALVNEISDRFDNVLTMIDQGGYDGKEGDIFAWQPTQAPVQRTGPPPPPPAPVPSGRPVANRGMPQSSKRGARTEHPKGQTTEAAALASESFFAKVDKYANSRLPMNLPPLKLYIPTYPLICLAAQYSERVYEPPVGQAERDARVEADWRTGTKAMVIKSVPMDDANTIVFAIRGTATFMDWAVNLNMEPTSPAGFLDDPGNLCHAGFLSVARKMVAPVARRLRQLLEEDTRRASSSLLITGHSAGGAVAALLYSHILSTSRAAESELRAVAGCFKRVHCITFGTPPVSLLPLAKPTDYVRCPQARKSVFLSFVNEGDPVTRADRAYVKSLLQLFAAPAPRIATSTESKTPSPSDKKPRRQANNKPASKTSTTPPPPAANKSKTAGAAALPTWPVPPCTLSCAGQIVVLRSGDPRAGRGRDGRHKAATVAARLHEGVVAQVATDAQLRGVVWGDPVAHMMRLYAGRVEVLAVAAVTGRLGG
ncbi:ed56b252-29a9-4ce1-8ca8-a4c537610988 [Thermothielavioides terrestris]|uniref:Ed56b252-29a9-4ce1-8ca8-a4c537610988 n=1 Tax=Thermothielavioides terrestris TaxID=2587410 RepID=A0A3S4ARN6_9PEZI|nr:ed56b252-29a9-4ce1-8ca8-a4c537610988 [Thermothielavioides terrestris]